MSTIWNRWLARHTELRRLALRWTRDRAEAEDALADAAIRAIERHDAAPPEDVDAWLVRLLFRVCMDHHRRHRARARLGRHVALTSPAPRSPEDAFVARAETTRLSRALERLPPDLRDAVALRCLDERSYEEIASIAGITPANARKRVQLGRAVLREAR